MKKTVLLTLIGLLAGAIDLIPLIMVKAPLFNMLSVLIFWVVAVIVIYYAKLLKRPILNGLVLSVILMLPLALAVAATNPTDFVPMMAMAVVLGPIAGFCIGKFIES